MNSQDSDTPIADSISQVNEQLPPPNAFQHGSDPSSPMPIEPEVPVEQEVVAEPEIPTSGNIPGAELGTGPWPNQEPVVEGVDEVSQDPNFIQNDKAAQ